MTGGGATSRIADGARGRLAGRVALVTGAGGPNGIGFACARILGREGASVALTSTTARIHERAAELQAGGVRAFSFVADLVDGKQADALVAAATDAFGRIDVLVNNAGMVSVGENEIHKELPDLSDAEWRHGIDITLTTAFNVTRAVLPGMVARGYGRIVNVASVTGPVVSNPRSSFYSAAKAGMVGLTRSVALDVGRKGITVNAVLPGWVLTGSSTEAENVGGRHTPIGRSGTPGEIAELVAFLASEAASYITGEAVVIDGGNCIQEYKGPSEGYY